MILLIDDSRMVLDSTRTLLELEGFSTMLAVSAGEAVERVKNGKVTPHIIICDFHVPGTENGVALIRELREIAETEIPAILSTGDTSLSVRDLTSTIRNCTLLNKPMSIDTMLDTISLLTKRSVDAE